MSPAAKTEWEVPEVGGAGKVKVSRDGSDIIVTWLCGTGRRFGAEALADRIDNVERVKAYADVWLEDVDSSSRKYTARVDEDGKFIADDHVSASTRGVEWDQLLGALKNALRKRGGRKA